MTRISGSWVCASVACTNGQAALWGVGALALLLLAAGFSLSLFAFHRSHEDLQQGGAHPRRFLAAISIMAAAIFLFAVALQIGALFFLPVCLS